MKYPKAIQNLIETFSKLPGVGPKTAERYIFYLLKQDAEELQKFAQSIAELKEKITICQNCLAVADENPCYICSDKKRDKTIICVVSNTRDMLAIEAIKQYNGIYHILGGSLDSISGIGPDKLNIKQLLEKIKKSNVKEIILGLNPNFSGEATAIYLTKIIKPLKIKVSRLAKGLPMGSDLEYADEITLSNSLKFRNEV
jgi:recombination protein RecR